MSTETRSSFFPESQHDISRLRQTATDAASDLTSTVAVHAAKAKGHLNELAGHVQEEGGSQFGQFKERLGDMVGSARNYASERPFICIGAALALGFLLGLSRRRFRD